MDARFADVPDGLWRRIAPLLPEHRKRTSRGRPRVPDRAVMAGILYRLRTGCQWKALPSQFGSGSTCHLRLQQWTKAGVFAAIFSELLRYYDRRKGIRWQWAALDTAMVKAPKGAPKPARTPRTERSWASSDMY
jgi:transposase